MGVCKAELGGLQATAGPPAAAVPAPAPGTSHRHWHVPEATPPGDTGPGPTPELQHPQLGEGLPVPHVAPLHTMTGRLPVPQPSLRLQGPPLEQGTAGGVRGSSVGTPRTGPDPLQRGPAAAPHGVPQPPPGCCSSPAPAAPQNPSPAQQDTPSAPGHGCWGDWEPGGCPGGRGGGTVHARGTPHPAARPGQDQAPAHRGVRAPAHAMKMLSWR